MNKTELIEAIANRTGLTKKDVEKGLNAMIETISDTIAAGEKVSIVDFGIFDTKHRASRTGRNPRTNELISIPAQTVPEFRPGKSLKEKVAK